jgi:hypothetical protein
MNAFSVGDRVWVMAPTKLSERRVGTIMAIGKTGNGSKYTVEWEMELPERGEKPPKYAAGQIRSANHRA